MSSNIGLYTNTYSAYLILSGLNLTIFYTIIVSPM